MDKRKWLQFCFYALASIIGLFLDLQHPAIKSVLCNPINIGSQIDESDRLELPLNSPVIPMERIK